MVYAPIYKDTVYTYSGESLYFRIESPSGNTLIQGEASEKPDGTPAKVYVNRLCEPFLAQGIDPTETGLTAQSGGSRVFYLVQDDETGQTLETYEFLRAYSGDWEGGSKILSDPIKPNVSRNMAMPFSVYNGGNIDVVVSGGSGGDCGYYLNFDKSTYTISANVSEDWRLYFNITSTNIPYESFPDGRLTGGGGVYVNEYPQGVVKTFIDGGKVNWIRDDTKNNARIYYMFNKNTTGASRKHKSMFYVGPPLCSTMKLVATITITQNA